MVGTDEEGIEETDGEVLDLVAVRCCLLVARQRHRASLLPRRRIPWLCCCCPVLLSLARCGPVLCLNEVGWGEGGTGGTYLVSTTTNDECRSSFWLPHRCWRCGTYIPHSCRQSFPSVGGRFHLWVAVFTYGRSFVFIGGQFRCISWLVVGAVLWLSWAASFCGHCGG